MDVKYSLLDKIENIKQDIKSQEYKEILELIAQIQDTKKTKYRLEILIISPSIEKEDGLTLSSQIEQKSFEIYLTEQAYNKVQGRVNLPFKVPEGIDSIQDKVNLGNIYGALQCQSTQVIDHNDEVFFTETRYILSDIKRQRN